MIAHVGTKNRDTGGSMQAAGAEEAAARMRTGWIWAHTSWAGANGAPATRGEGDRQLTTNDPLHTRAAKRCAELGPGTILGGS